MDWKMQKKNIVEEDKADELLEKARYYFDKTKAFIKFVSNYVIHNPK